MKKYNFYAGPAILPEKVMKEASEGIIELKNSGLSIIEMSHRSKEFSEVLDRAKRLVIDLYKLNDDYEVLFLQGGASMQFLMVPFNLYRAGRKASYLDTGAWALKAIKEAKYFGDIDIAGSSADQGYSYIPKSFKVDDACSYFHFTTNNTIYGTELADLQSINFPIPEDVPVIADMSSNIFSRKINAQAFDLIYAGAQKNMGPAGTTLVIIKKSILGKVSRKIPTMLDYQTHISKGSLFNTGPVFAIYVSMLTMQWMQDMGGLEVIEKRNIDKSKLLYDEIDRNGMFYGTVAKEDRSRMNVSFLLHDKSKESSFLNMATEAGIVGIKGHRSVGGFRASIYNAMEIESVQVLVNLMQDFERKFG